MISGQYGSGRRQAFGERTGWIAADAGTRSRMTENRDNDISAAAPAISLGMGALLAVGAVFIYKLLKRK